MLSARTPNSPSGANEETLSHDNKLWSFQVLYSAYFSGFSSPALEMNKENNPIAKQRG